MFSFDEIPAGLLDLRYLLFPSRGVFFDRDTVGIMDNGTDWGIWKHFPFPLNTFTCEKHESIYSWPAGMGKWKDTLWWQQVYVKDTSKCKTSTYRLSGLTNPHLAKRGEYSYTPKDTFLQTVWKLWVWILFCYNELSSLEPFFYFIFSNFSSTFSSSVVPKLFWLGHISSMKIF